MDIRKHIKELLFTHDCVIIPGFGGFVTSYQSSEIQRFKNVVYPPSKSILFNRRLQTNDGVLITRVAQQEKVDYRTAEEKVRQWADTWNRQINNKGMLMFPDIGKLYINSANALVFLPELRKNYLPETFGLKPIAYQLHSESSTIASTTAKIVKMERKPTQPTIEDDATSEAQGNGKRTGLIFGSIAAAILLLFFVPQLFLQDMLPVDMRIRQLNVMPFFKPDTTTAKAPEKKELLPSAEQAAIDSNESAADTTETAEAYAEEIPAEETPESAPVEVAEPARTQEPLPTTGNFYIAFGTSDFISDAIRLKKQLDEEHSKTFEVFPKDGGYVVGLRAGESQQQAETAMNYFRGSNSDLRVVVRD